MSSLLEAVARARDARQESERAFRNALVQARRVHTWPEIADVAGLSPSTCRYLSLDEDERRRWNSHHWGRKTDTSTAP